MSTQKEVASLQKSNFLQNQLRAKELINQEKEKKEKQKQDLSNLFKAFSKKDLFESNGTAKLNEDGLIGLQIKYGFFR